MIHVHIIMRYRVCRCHDHVQLDICIEEPKRNLPQDHLLLYQNDHQVLYKIRVVEEDEKKQGDKKCATEQRNK